MKLDRCRICGCRPEFERSDEPGWPVKLVHTCEGRTRTVYHKSPQRAAARWARLANDLWLGKLLETLG